MAELRQASGTTYAKFYGWYGTCESECEAFSLDEYKKIIYSVTQFGRNSNQDAGASTLTWLHNRISFLQPFTELE